MMWHSIAANVRTHLADIIVACRIAQCEQLTATLAELEDREEYSSLIPDLLSNLCALDFESRKRVAAIYNYLLVCGLDGTDADLYKPLMTKFRDYVEANYDAIIFYQC